jgi:glycosyltransferase involved in cell wall biosynthesis
MNPSVALLRNNHEAVNWSMKLYADHVARGLTQAGINLVDVVLPSPVPILQNSAFGRKADHYWARYWSYPRAFRRLQADLYHIVDHANAHWIRRFPAERTMITCHDLILLKLAAGEISWPGKAPRLATAAFRWSVSHLSRAAAVLCVSETTRRDVARLLGCPPNKLHVVYQGVDSAFRRISDPAARLQARQQFGIDWPITLLHVGQHGFYKNVEGLIEAMARLPRHWRERVHLVKAGRGFNDTQAALIRRRGLEGRVHDFGLLQLADLVRLYNVADMLVFPSLYEGFGWPVLEAMACGTAVVCSDRGSLAEVAGDAAHFVDPGDPNAIMRGIVRVLEDDESRAELIRRGFARAGQFQWERAYQQIRSLYDTLQCGNVLPPLECPGTSGVIAAEARS